MYVNIFSLIMRNHKGKVDDQNDLVICHDDGDVMISNVVVLGPDEEHKNLPICRLYAACGTVRPSVHMVCISIYNLVGLTEHHHSTGIMPRMIGR